jgi:hypothetical protein
MLMGKDTLALSQALRAPSEPSWWVAVQMPVDRSHTRTVPSFSLETAVWPSSDNPTFSTLRVRFCGMAVQLPLVRSQRRTVISKDPERATRPSADNVTLEM